MILLDVNISFDASHLPQLNSAQYAVETDDTVQDSLTRTSMHALSNYSYLQLFVDALLYRTTTNLPGTFTVCFVCFLVTRVSTTTLVCFTTVSTLVRIECLHVIYICVRFVGTCVGVLMAY